VIASIIAVAFGVIFWAWNLLWSATEGAFLFFPPAQTLLYGRLADAAGAERADHPEAGRVALHRDARRAHLGAARQPVGRHRHPAGSGARASAPSWFARCATARFKLPAALLAGALTG
jgi:energy-coupling factor transport system substrate-specific component